MNTGSDCGPVGIDQATRHNPRAGAPAQGGCAKAKMQGRHRHVVGVLRRTARFSRSLVIRCSLVDGRIGQATLDILDRFHHPGFSAYEGEGVSAGDSAARERLGSYLVHPAFSLARLHCDRDAGVVTYDARAPSRSHPSSPSPERLSPLDSLATLTSFIPEKGQQVVRYYGYYSNKARGQRCKRQ